MAIAEKRMKPANINNVFALLFISLSFILHRTSSAAFDFRIFYLLQEFLIAGSAGIIIAQYFLGEQPRSIFALRFQIFGNRYVGVGEPVRINGQSRFVISSSETPCEAINSKSPSIAMP